jgi:hypothetical protein
MSDSIDQIIREAEAAIARDEAAAVAPATTPPADAPAAQRAPGAPESLTELEARLRAQHDQRVSGDRERDQNEELLRRVLGSAYRPLPTETATPAAAPTRRDGSPLTELDVRLANELERLLPRVLDWSGARVPPGYRR